MKRRNNTESRSDMRQTITDFLLEQYPEAKVDRWGHVKVVRENNTYRFKFMTQVVRLEKQVRIGDHNEWIRVQSYSMKELYRKACGNEKKRANQT